PQSVSSYIMAVPSDAVKMIAYCFDGNKISIKKALEGASEGSEIVVLIGPEGDFSPAEAASAISRGFIPVHLGDSRLRTETAAVTAAEAVYFNFMK
ncbi:MAG: RNA methyltransferase, partial [Bacteroidales bacterium]|nr:RNA methyltransferase [Bacteroidales bacterium]